MTTVNELIKELQVHQKSGHGDSPVSMLAPGQFMLDLSPDSDNSHSIEVVVQTIMRDNGNEHFICLTREE